MTPVALLISGRGSNMRAILDARLAIELVAVISNVADAPGLEVARMMGVATAVVDHTRFAERSAFDAALAAKIDEFSPALVLLAGFTRILGESFVEHYQRRLINIHPSLLPAFPGLHTHRRALEQGVRIHGCTVHFVTHHLDQGPIIIQTAVPVHPGDSELALADRVLRQEHLIYPKAVGWLVEGKVALDANDRVIYTNFSSDDASLTSPKEAA